MTVSIEPLKAWHLLALDIQPEQIGARPFVTAELADVAETLTAGTALVDGKPVICAGLMDADGRRFVWAFLGCDAGRAMLAATRAIEAMLANVSRETSVFAHIRPDFPAAVRWARLLGFVQMAGAFEALPDGKKYGLWVRRNG